MKASGGGPPSIDLTVNLLASNTLSIVQVGVAFHAASRWAKYMGERARIMSMYRNRKLKCFVQLRNPFFRSDRSWSLTIGNSFSSFENASSAEGSCPTSGP